VTARLAAFAKPHRALVRFITVITVADALGVEM
jgi:hypothetical protein